MRKIIDIYGHFRRVDEMYNRDNSWYGRILVNKDNIFEGIVSSYDGNNKSLVFGTLDDDLISLTECPRNINVHPKEVLAEYRNRKYKGVASKISDEDEFPLEECKIVLIPADKTREESDYELERLEMRIADIKGELQEKSRELYQTFEAENKPVQKTKK